MGGRALKQQTGGLTPRRLGQCPAVRGVRPEGPLLLQSNGVSAEQRLAVRTARVAPLVADFEAWMKAERAKLSRNSEVAKALNDMFNRWDSFTRFLADG